MKQVLKYTGYILVLLIVGFMIWRFSYIIAWVLVAAVLSFIGHPLVRFFDRIHFRKLKMPHFRSIFNMKIFNFYTFSGTT